MKKIIIFIFGMLTTLAFIPIIESLVEIVLCSLEPLKAKSTKKVLKINKEINELQSELEPIDTQAIGFEIPSDEEYYDEEDKIILGFK